MNNGVSLETVAPDDVGNRGNRWKPLDGRWTTASQLLDNRRPNIGQPFLKTDGNR